MAQRRMAILGATNQTYAIANSARLQAGGYTVIVSNAFNGATSAVASVVLNTNQPAIAADPQSQTVLLGATSDLERDLGGQLFAGAVVPMVQEQRVE